MAQPGLPAMCLSDRSGQALVLMALLIPLVLLPIAAYGVEAGYAASRQAQLQWACARAAEEAVQQVDVGVLRSTSTLGIATPQAQSAADQALQSLDPRAVLDRITFTGTDAQVTAHEVFWSWLLGRLTIRAVCSAHLAGGYDSPSS